MLFFQCPSVLLFLLIQILSKVSSAPTARTDNTILPDTALFESAHTNAPFSRRNPLSLELSPRTWGTPRGKVTNGNGVLTYTFQDYTLTRGQKMGQGAQGEVYQATLMVKGQKKGDVALKISDSNDLTKGGELARKISSSSIPSIVTLFKVSSKEYCMVMSLVTGVTLKNHIEESNFEPYDSGMFFMFKDFLDGLPAMPSVGVAHRDINPMNILVGYRGMVLVDWDMATTDKISKDVVTTPVYQSPEIYSIGQKTKRYKKYNAQSGDVFAMAMVLLKMVSPFQDTETHLNFRAFWEDIAENSGGQAGVKTIFTRYGWDSKSYPKLLDLLSRVLCAESEGRLSMAEFSRQLADTEPFLDC